MPRKKIKSHGKDKASNSRTFYVLIALYIVGVLSRLSYIRQEIHPYQFCDEGIFSGEVSRLLQTNTFSTIEFRSGGFNIYPVLFPLKFLASVLHLTFDTNTLLVTGRIILPLLLGTATIFPIFSASKKILNSEKYGILAAALFVASPFAFAQSHIWYPDGYLMFFSAITFNYLAKFKTSGWDKRDYIGLGFCLALAVSTKYTALILTIPFLYMFYKLRRVRPTERKLINYQNMSVATFITTGAILNFSVLSHFSQLLTGVHSDVKIYKIASYFRFSGIVFYWVNALFLALSLTGSLLLISGIYWIAKKNLDRRVAGLLFVTPAVYLTFMGLSRQVLNRNIDIYIPLICILAAIGVRAINETSKSQFFKYSILCISIIPMVSQTAFEIISDIKIDSRISAHNWLAKNIPAGSTVGVNLGCSESSPADGLGYSLISDETMKTEQKYYVFVSYWNSPFIGYYTSSNIFQELNMKYLHFYHFNDSDLLKWKSTNSEISDLTPKGYSIIKNFHTNGPDVLVLAKNIP